MNSLIVKYREYENKKDWFINYLRIHHEWDDEKYIEMISLINDILDEFKNNYLFPKDLVYFFSSEVDSILGTVENNAFYNYIPPTYTKKEYEELIEMRKKELIDLRDNFLYGEF
jgi:hypothetical protein